MKPTLVSLLVAAAAGTACAQNVQLETLPGIYPLDMSTDGSVIVGNDHNFETVRWTAGTGVVNLGRGTHPLGVGAGTPDCSDDGTRVSATIINAAGSLATQGLWTEGSGWVDLMPPSLPDGGTIDQSYGSAWGLSGNGEHVLGLYWRPGNSATGLAHASFSGTTAGSVIDLGSTMKDSRANHANFDGSVVVGWDTSDAFGYWSPTVWENGTLTHLNTNLGWAMANYITADGNIIGGDTFDELFMRSDATIWTRDGSGWTETIIGSLPGTAGPFGLATVRSMTPDASTIVGFNKFNNSAAAAGFVWTADGGMVNAIDWITAQGLVIPPDLLILDATCISNDGRIVVGIGVNINNGAPIGFRVSPICRVDFNDDTLVNFFDISDFITAFTAGEVAADFNNDGNLNAFDIFEFIGSFNDGCP